MISILIPTIGRDSTIMRAVLSAVQTKQSLIKEILILDNSQSEGFGRFLRDSVGKLNDERVQCLKYSERRSMAASWNSGMEAATQPWLLYLHDDDELLPDAVSELSLELLQDLNSSFICCDYNVTDGTKLITTKRVVDSQSDLVISIVDNCPKFVSTLINSAKLKEIGGWSDRYGYFLDLMGFLQLYKCGEVKFHSVVLGCYWKHEDNASSLSQREVGYGESIPAVTLQFFNLYDSKEHRKALFELFVNYVYETDCKQQSWHYKILYKINRFIYARFIRIKA